MGRKSTILYALGHGHRGAAHLPRAKRVKSGGNKKKSYTEGWVEFADKKRALRISRTLNNTPMVRVLCVQFQFQFSSQRTLPKSLN